MTPTELVQHYQAGLPTMWEHKMQQTINHLLPYVTPVTLTGKMTLVDYIEKRDMEQKLQRFERIKINENVYSRRAIFSKKFVDVAGFDEDDERKLYRQHLPVAETMAEQQNAAQRTAEKEILNAVSGNAWEGENGNIAVPLPSSQIIQAEYSFSNPLSTTKTGMTVDKVLRVRRKLMESEAFGQGVQNGTDRLATAWSAAQIEDLAQDARANNKDYVYAIDKLRAGEVDTFLNFSVLRTQQVATHLEGSDLIRDVPFWVKSRVKFGFGEAFKSKMWIANEISEAIVIRSTMDCGGARMEEEGVVIVECLER